MSDDVTARGREQWIDIAKGIGIFLVVFEHVVRGLVLANIAPNNALHQITDYTIYTFHMPLFFFLSGLTISWARPVTAREFFLRRLVLIAYAYFLWSSMQVLLQWGFASYVNSPATLFDLARLFYAPKGQFWFLYVLFLCHLIFLVTGGIKKYIVIAIFISLAARISGFGFIGVIHLASVFFIFYAAGILLWRAAIQLKGSGGWGIALAVIFAVSAVANWFLFDGNFSSMGAIPAAFAGIALVVLLSKLIAGSLGEFVAYLGRLSLPIYLAHVIAASGVRIIMHKMGVPHDVTVYILGGVVAGLGAPIALYVVLARLNLLAYAGFAPFAWASTQRVKIKAPSASLAEGP